MWPNNCWLAAATPVPCRTNFCSICRVEREAADAYLQATQFNLAAAVEEFIARHMLPPTGLGEHPDAGEHMC